MNRSAGGSKGPKNLQSTDAWRTIEEEFLSTGEAAPVQQSLTLARDKMAVEAYQAAVEPVFPHSVAMLAGGAYGRGHTFPYSELDIVLLFDSDKHADALKELLPEFVRMLWNAGLRLNSAVLTVAECLEAVERGSVSAFSLLDRRLLAGDRAVYEKLESKLPAALALHGQKMSQHLCDLVRARHARYQNTPHHAEPDVKEGPGGLQDVRLIDWIATLKTEPQVDGGELQRAAALVSSARCFLHYRAGCDHNILDFEARESLASQLFAHGQSSSDWMDAYFEAARTIFNEARRAIEGVEKGSTSLLENFREYRSRLSNLDFTVSRERLFLRNSPQLESDPALVLRMMEFIGRHGVAPAPETERRLEASRQGFAAYCAQPQPLWATFRSILAGPHAAMALRTLESTGLMRGLFPEWGAVEHRIAADSEYRYTLGEHSLRAMESILELGLAANPERQRFAGVLSEIDDVTLLLFALLFHETGRGGADPAGLAAERAHAAMTRIQMADEAQSTVEFLIRHQSDLADAGSGRDMDDPATARLLAERVGTIERLKLLAAMTYAKIVALSAEDKVAWRLEQLWRAYSVAQHELMRELETDRIRRCPRTSPKTPSLSRAFRCATCGRTRGGDCRASPTLRTEPPDRRGREAGSVGRGLPADRLWRATRPSCSPPFAGAISSFGLDILKAEAFSNAAGVVLDMFVFGDPKRMLQQNPSEADRLGDLIQRVALGKTDAQRLMRGRGLPDPSKRHYATAGALRFRGVPHGDAGGDRYGRPPGTALQPGDGLLVERLQHRRGPSGH